MWYVEYLLLNAELIQARAEIDADDFNDLLVLSKELDRLKEVGAVSEEQFTIIKLITLSGCIPQGLATKTFREVCKLLSLSLGGIYTDFGYVSYMVNKYHLTLEQEEKLRKFICSSSRHKILKQPFEDK